MNANASFKSSCTFKEIFNGGEVIFENTLPLHLAIIQEGHGIANRLIKKGADVNASCCVTQKSDSGDEVTNGLTPLHLAAQTKLRKVIEILVEYGADSQVKDSAGLTPLDYAKGADWGDDFEKLLEGKKLEKKDGIDPKFFEKIKQKMDQQKKTLTFSLQNLSLKLAILRKKLGLLKKNLENLQELLLVKRPYP